MLTTLLNPTIWLLALVAGVSLYALLAGQPTGWVRTRVLGALSVGAVVAVVATAAVAGASTRLVLGYLTPGDYAEDVIAARSYLVDRDLYADEPRAAFRSWLATDPPPLESWALPGVASCQADALAQRDRFYRSQAHQPFLLILAIPLVAVGGPRGYYVVLSAVSLASVLLVATGLGRTAGLARRSRLALMLAVALLAWQPVLASLRGGTISVVVAALIVTAWRLLGAGRLAGGVAVGLAASLHPLALPLLVWLPRISWRAFCGGAGTLIATVAVTGVVAGPAAYQEFWRGALETGRTYAAAPQNYALITKAAWLASLTAAPSTSIALALLLSTVALAAAASRPAGTRTTDAEYSLAVALGLLVAPVTWSPDLAALIVPLTLLFERAWSAPTPWPLLAWAALALGLSLPDGPVLYLWALLAPLAGPGPAGILAALPSFAMVGLCVWLVSARVR